MTDEEIDELAECLQAACILSEESGRRVSASDRRCFCPFATLTPTFGLRPTSEDVWYLLVHVSTVEVVPTVGEICDFMNAFDEGIVGPNGDYTKPFLALGLEFRRLYP